MTALGLTHLFYLLPLSQYLAKRKINITFETNIHEIFSIIDAANMIKNTDCASRIQKVLQNKSFSNREKIKLIDKITSNALNISEQSEINIKIENPD